MTNGGKSCRSVLIGETRADTCGGRRLASRRLRSPLTCSAPSQHPECKLAPVPTSMLLQGSRTRARPKNAAAMSMEFSWPHTWTGTPP